MVPAAIDSWPHALITDVHGRVSSRLFVPERGVPMLILIGQWLLREVLETSLISKGQCLHKADDVRFDGGAHLGIVFH
jgi:hypothetical protein